LGMVGRGTENTASASRVPCISEAGFGPLSFPSWPVPESSSGIYPCTTGKTLLPCPFCGSVKFFVFPCLVSSLSIPYLSLSKLGMRIFPKMQFKETSCVYCLSALQSVICCSVFRLLQSLLHLTPYIMWNTKYVRYV
jgi:hypothetical protein